MIDVLKTLLHFLLTKILRVAAILFCATLIIFLLIHNTSGNTWKKFPSEQRLSLGYYR